MTSIQIDLPWPPGANHLWRSGRGRVYRSKKYMDWIHEAGWHIKLAKFSMIEGEFSASIVLNPPDKRRVDLDGRIKAILDLAQTHHLIENDYLCRLLVVAYGPEGAIPGACLTLKSMQNKDAAGRWGTDQPPI